MRSLLPLRHEFASICLALLVYTTARAETNVPLFLSSREPAAAAKTHPPERWSATENVAWKTDLPGLGWSSPIVWGNRVFLTTCVNTGEDREPRKGLYLEDVDANKYPPEKSEHLWKVYCLNLDNGSIVWEQTSHKGVPAKPHHIKNTLASETAATDGEHLYVLFGNVGLYCYDLDGKLQWSHAITLRETRYGWGTSMSPIVHEDRVYLVDDNEEQSTLLALDKRHRQSDLAGAAGRKDKLFDAVCLEKPAADRVGDLGHQLGHELRPVGQGVVEDQREIDLGDSHPLRTVWPAVCHVGSRGVGRESNLCRAARRVG